MQSETFSVLVFRTTMGNSIISEGYNGGSSHVAAQKRAEDIWTHNGEQVQNPNTHERTNLQNPLQPSNLLEGSSVLVQELVV
jgi:hypothetical protein